MRSILLGTDAENGARKLRLRRHVRRLAITQTVSQKEKVP